MSKRHPSGSPLVSIIVPVFNGERYVRQSLDSILAQTYSPMEVLVMDNASSDSTPRILASYGDRIKIYTQPCNRGVFGNVNDGLSRARGRYIAVYHADDIYLPTIVEREAAFLEDHPEVGAVFCKDTFIDPDGSEAGRLELPMEVRGQASLDYPVVVNALLTYKNIFLRCPGCMVRAAVYQEVGSYRAEEFLESADLEMWLRIARRHRIAILEEYLFCYRYGHGSVAQRYKHLRTEPDRFFQIMDLYLGEGAKALAKRGAVRDYEGHRAEDWVLCAVNHYILGHSKESLQTLRQVRLRHVLSGRRIQRIRILLLFLLLSILVRAPRVPALATFFYRRWHAGGGRTLAPRLQLGHVGRAFRSPVL